MAGKAEFETTADEATKVFTDAAKVAEDIRTAPTDVVVGEVVDTEPKAVRHPGFGKGVIPHSTTAEIAEAENREDN